MSGQLWECALCESTLAGANVRRATSDRAICAWCEGELARTQRRRCRGCNTVQTLAAFGSDRHCCKACKATAQRRRYQTNPRIREAALRRQRDAYAVDPEATRRKNRTSWRKHRDVRLAHKRVFRATHRARLVAAARAKRERDPDTFNAKRRDWYARRGAMATRLRMLRRVRGAS